jgi:hypothetical protein
VDWWWGAAGRALVVVSPDPEASNSIGESDGLQFPAWFRFPPFFFSLDEEGGREPSGLGAADESSRRRQAKASFALEEKKNNRVADSNRLPLRVCLALLWFG